MSSSLLSHFCDFFFCMLNDVSSFMKWGLLKMLTKEDSCHSRGINNEPFDHNIVIKVGLKLH